MSDARRRALEILHAADVAGAAPAPRSREPAGVRALVAGVAAHRDEVDEVIRGTAEHWALERMPVVDRNVLRLAVYELRHTDAPPGEVVEAAVALARLLSTEDSGRFVHGILGRIVREARRS